MSSEYQKYKCDIVEISDDNKQQLISSLKLNKDITGNIIIKNCKINYTLLLYDKLFFPLCISNLVNEYLMNCIYKYQIESRRYNNTLTLYDNHIQVFQIGFIVNKYEHDICTFQQVYDYVKILYIIEDIIREY